MAERGLDGAVELTCPACGALVEADSLDELVTRAGEHTLDAHGYALPAAHAVAAAEPGAG